MDKMVVSICIGSSCSHKGSSDAVKYVKKYIEEHDLEEKIILKATFCLGACINGFNVKFNEKIKAFHSMEEFKLFFHNAFDSEINSIS